MKKTLYILLIAAIFVGCAQQNAARPSHENYETMPVFRNPLHLLPAEYAQHAGVSLHGLTAAEMTERAENILEIIEFDEDTLEHLPEYDFSTIHFVPNEAGELARTTAFPPPEAVLTQKIGYFPIITPEDALALMSAGQGSFGVDMGQPRPAPPRKK